MANNCQECGGRNFQNTEVCIHCGSFLADAPTKEPLIHFGWQENHERRLPGPTRPGRRTQHDPGGSFELRGPLGNAIGFFLIFIVLLFIVMVLTGRIDVHPGPERICISSGDVAETERMHREGWTFDQDRSNSYERCYHRYAGSDSAVITGTQAPEDDVSGHEY